MKNNQLTVWILVGLFLSTFYLLPHFYFCLISAFVTAYLLEPLVEFLEKKKVPRYLGSLLGITILTFVIVAAIVVIAPKIVQQGRELVRKIPQFLEHLKIVLARLSDRHLGYNAFEDIDQWINSLFTSGDVSTSGGMIRPLGGLVGNVFSTTLKAVSSTLGLLVIPLMSFYMLNSFPNIWKKIEQLTPYRYKKTVNELQKKLNEVTGGFIRGQLLVASILSLYYVTMFTILRLDLSLLLGVLAGFLNIIPYVGIASVFALTIVASLIQEVSGSQLLVIVLTFAVGMSIEGMILTPKIVGKKVGLSPLLIIMSLLVGVELLGLAGALFAIPSAAIANVFISFGVEWYRKSKFYKD
ncbi:MAG: AI-2E family transporter [Bacteriovoracia bacterium]